MEPFLDHQGNRRQKKAFPGYPAGSVFAGVSSLGERLLQIGYKPGLLPLQIAFDKGV